MAVGMLGRGVCIIEVDKTNISESEHVGMYII